jgi:DeoR/GlpR family transcriptional regulator of sugar metabolism
VLRKARIWERIHSQSPVNERQRQIINRLLDGFQGKLSTSKYAKLAKCSGDTALRDIRILLDRGILTQDAGGGRNTSYRLAELEGQPKTAVEPKTGRNKGGRSPISGLQVATNPTLR